MLKIVKTDTGSSSTHWLRTPQVSPTNFTSAFRYTEQGYPGVNTCSTSHGARPAFTLPSSLMVDDSGAVLGNTAPTVPSSISVSPNPPVSEKSLTVSWNASSDTESNLSGYTLERQYNGGSWSQVYKGSSRTFTEMILASWVTVAYRVKAYDSANAESTYRTSSTYTINLPPVIFGGDSDLGIKTEGFTQSYTVTHPQVKAVTITEKVDNTILRTYAPELGAEQTLDLTGIAFMAVLNGNHTLTITATDSSGQTATLTYTFAKSVTKALIMLLPPLPADDIPTKAIMNTVAAIPAGAAFSVEVCNNGNDVAPTWEDVTAKVLSGNKIFLANTTKTAEDWGFNFRVTADRNSAVGDGHIFSVGGNFQ